MTSALVTFNGSSETGTTEAPFSFTWELTPIFSPIESIPWYLLAFASIFLNGLILISFAKEKRLRTYINYYVINLAIADFCVSIYVMPVYAVVTMLGHYWPFFGYYGCKIFQGVSYSFVTVTILAVIAICSDRFYATVAPIHYFSHRSKGAAFRINVICWIVAFCIWIPFNTLWPIWTPSSLVVQTACGPDYGKTFLATMVAISVLFWFPILIITLMNATVYYEIAKSGALSVGKSFEDKSSSRRDTQVTSLSQDSMSHETSDGVTTSQAENAHKNRSFVPDNENPGMNEVTNNGTWIGAADVYLNQVKGENDETNEIQEGLLVVIRTNNKDITKNSSKNDIVVDGISRVPSKQIVVTSQSHDTTKTEGTTEKLNETAGLHKNSLSMNEQTRKKESVKESVKAFRILSVIVLSYFLSWVMFGVVVVYISLCWRGRQVKCTSGTVDLIAQYLSLCNSLFNPICYATVQPLLRETIAKIFRR
ncbi:Muscarinic acetylcholine receptor M2 [Holothuria leucospilota]|uniref:Muscarinic acetylcholine receptor M2 n=1 Tax=Holothuria leucospilota TaxID=206669 RepID=A0A9Q1HFH7_HOLLE|nr:Muscarinic acetylcholine receptor M2 [Holothuria leucospilota]